MTSSLEPSDGRRLLADGVTVQIIAPNGELADADLRFSARSLARLEDQFGSLDDFAEALRRKPFNTVAAAFAVTMGISPALALDAIDTRRMSDYVTAIGNALEEALPTQDAKQANPTNAGADSPGAGSTGSPSSAGTSTPSGSGA